MPLVPDDPTKAQVWLRNVGTPEITMDLYVPRGSKGDPGGFVNAVALPADVNLDAIVSPGDYRLTSTFATLALNYPRANTGAFMRVVGQNTGLLMQVVTPIPAINVRGQWHRSLVSGIWTPWQFIAVQRVDQTAGRAIYTWDDLNNRDQLVYGDTGVRDIAASHGNGSFGALAIRRYGAMVHLWCTNWTVPSNGAAPLSTLLNVSTGFRNPNTLHSVAGINGNALGNLTLGANFSSLVMGGSLAGQVVSFTMVYSTVDPWPTTLPGVASGLIPNL